MFVDYLQRGLACGGWVLGFVAVLGAMALAITAIVAAIGLIVGDDEDEPADE